MAKKKYYVVWEGNLPGIYETWKECQAQIKNFPNARYKSFTSYNEAADAFGGKAGDYIGKNKVTTKPKRISAEARKHIVWNSICVDAACSGNPGDLEYRGVNTKSGTEIFRIGPFKHGTNNVGEFLALVHGLALLKREGKDTLPIYSDSRTAMAWVRNKKLKTTLKKTKANEPLFQLVDRGLKWLHNNSYNNPILKWKTKEWGEIPADFGRK